MKKTNFITIEKLTEGLLGDTAALAIGLLAGYLVKHFLV